MKDNQLRQWVFGCDSLLSIMTKLDHAYYLKTVCHSVGAAQCNLICTVRCAFLFPLVLDEEL